MAVLPEPTEIQLKISVDDLEYTPTRGSGPGGQNKNKTETAVVLVHKPTKLTVRAESERSLKQNKEIALSILKARLWSIESNRIHTERANERKSQVGSGMRGDKRRTIQVQNGTVIDHITGERWEFKRYERGDW